MIRSGSADLWNICSQLVMLTNIFSIWRLYSESLAAPCGVIGGSMRSHWRLHAESIWGSMRGHSAAPCGVIRRLHAESFGGSMRSHSVAPCGVICRLQAESFAGSAASHLVAPSRAIIPVARIGTPSLIQNSVALL